MADIVVSRAGANAICELLALKKPNLLIPLSAGASRGDQILNARSFEAQGFSMVIDEDYLSPGLLIEKVHALYGSRQTYIDAMGKAARPMAIPSNSGNYKRDNGLNFRHIENKRNACSANPSGLYTNRMLRKAMHSIVMNKKRCANERFGRKQPFLLGTAVSDPDTSNAQRFFLIFERMNVRLSYPRISSFTAASSSAVGLVCFQFDRLSVIFISGNQVDMEMRNSLSCCRTIILNEVKAIAVQLLRHLTCHLFRQGKCFLTPVIRQLIKISKMLLRHHEACPFVAGPRSRITRKLSSSYNVLDGISPFAILQKIQSSFFM